MATVGLISTCGSSEAQVLRRFRENVREAIIPQVLPLQRIQTFNSVLPQGRLQPRPVAEPQPRYVQPQVRVQPRPVTQPQPRFVQPQVRVQRPALQPSTSNPQRLTPYSRLTPQQRTSVPQQQFSTGPRLVAPAPVGNPAVQSTGGARVRIVTYLEPRSGRTFQRRYLLPGNSPTGITQVPQGQIVTGRRSIFNQPTPTFGDVTSIPSVASIPISTPPVSPRQSLVPPIQFSQQIIQPIEASPGLLPSLSGPSLTAPETIAQPIAASIDISENPSTIETASAEVEAIPFETETSPEGIPDLSGITVEPAPVTVDTATVVDPAPADAPGGADQELFFNDDFADEASDDPGYSVLEEDEIE